MRYSGYLGFEARVCLTPEHRAVELVPVPAMNRPFTERSFEGSFLLFGAGLAGSSTRHMEEMMALHSTGLNAVPPRLRFSSPPSAIRRTTESGLRLTQRLSARGMFLYTIWCARREEDLEVVLEMPATKLRASTILCPLPGTVLRVTQQPRATRAASRLLVRNYEFCRKLE